MIVLPLKPHPATPPENVRAVEVEALFTGDDALLTFTVKGGRLALPPRRMPARADGLWKTTCFELFLKAAGSEPYVEFNFSPSTEWAAYRFDGYRAGMSDLRLDAPPHIDRPAGSMPMAATPYVMQVDCDLDTVPPGRLMAGIGAVIEEAGGPTSYWALAHPAGKPDFHHPDCFAYEIPAPDAP